MQKIFVNSRNGDGEYAATHIAATLMERLGSEHIFKSSHSIPPGDDYASMLLDMAASCDVMLSVIGPRWLTAVTEDGTRKLDREDDWVRREIAIAIDKGRRVIPILLTGANMPVAGELPYDIRALAGFQYRRLDHRNAAWDMARLVAELREFIPELNNAEVEPMTMVPAEGEEQEAKVINHFHNVAQDHARVGAQISAITGNAYFGLDHSPATDLGPHLNSLRMALEMAFRSGRLDSAAHEAAATELDGAIADASASDPEARGRFLRAMRRVESLVKDVAPLAALAATILAKAMS